MRRASPSLSEPATPAAAFAGKYRSVDCEVTRWPTRVNDREFHEGVAVALRSPNDECRPDQEIRRGVLGLANDGDGIAFQASWPYPTRPARALTFFTLTARASTRLSCSKSATASQASIPTRLSKHGKSCAQGRRADITLMRFVLIRFRQVTRRGLGAA
jgi:hypothetical protein